jgi:hypothetical protein
MPHYQSRLKRILATTRSWTISSQLVIPGQEVSLEPLQARSTMRRSATSEFTNFVAIMIATPNTSVEPPVESFRRSQPMKLT